MKLKCAYVIFEWSLSSPDLDRARAAIRDADVEGPYKYSIEQENCH